MALKGKPIAIGTSDTTIYTCPAATEASIHGLVFANNTGSSATITIKVYIQSLGTTTTVATGITVAANSTYTWPKPIDVNAGDYIQAAASTGSALVCLYSVYEGGATPAAVGFTPRGVWSSGATYAVNDAVSYNGSSYLAIQAGTNHDPSTATAYWMILASKGDTGATGASGTNGINGTNGTNGIDGTGDVNGPSSSVDSEIALFSGTTGKLLKRATLTGIVKATSGVAAQAISGTDYLAPPSGTSILKANSGGALVDATAGTDYLAPPSGTSILKANSGGALANASAGTDYLAPSLGNTAVTGFKTATFNSQTTIATTTGAITVDWTSAQNQKQTEPTGSITYTFTAPPGPCHLQLLIDSDGTSTAQTITWPASVIWFGATWAGAANKKAIINFWYDGSNYFAVGTNQV